MSADTAPAGPRIGRAVALATFDAQGRVIDSNAALQAMLQRPAHELAGRLLGSFLSPAGRVVFDNHLLPLLHLNGQVHELALQLRPAQGGDVFVLCSAARVEADDGAVRHECAFMRMSERKRTEDELLRLKRTADRLPGALFQLLRRADGSLELPTATTAVRALFGLEAQAPRAAAQALFDAVVPEDRPRLHESLQASAQAMAPWQVEVRVRLGERFAWRAVEARPQSQGGGAVLWHGYASDIDGRKAAEATLAEAIQVKDMLLHEVNHRVKNNLQVISSLLSLQQRSLQDDGARQAVAQAQARVAVVAQLHQRLYQSGTHTTVDFAQHACRLAADTLASLGASPRIGLDLDCRGPLPLVMDEAVPLSLVLSELLTNAVKHAFATGQSGRLQVHVERDATGLRLLVADDGTGLPADFDPARSAGLGMRIVRALLLQLDARLQLLCSGRGAGFLVVVPPGGAATATAG